MQPSQNEPNSSEDDLTIVIDKHKELNQTDRSLMHNVLEIKSGCTRIFKEPPIHRLIDT